MVADKNSAAERWPVRAKWLPWARRAANPVLWACTTRSCRVGRLTTRAASSVEQHRRVEGVEGSVGGVEKGEQALGFGLVGTGLFRTGLLGLRLLGLWGDHGHVTGWQGGVTRRRGGALDAGAHHAKRPRCHEEDQCRSPGRPLGPVRWVSPRSSV